MKKEKEKKDVVLPDSVVRLLEFVESHGGPTKVARTMGTSPQIFYNYRNGLSEPGSKVYIEIKRGYPDFDANYILFGQTSNRCLHIKRLRLVSK